MRFVNMSQEEFEAMLKHAASEGRDGDTQLVHVNKDEEKILKAAGGRGTINPKTGLKEYAEGGIGSGGRERTDRGNETRGGSSGSGERGTKSQQQDRRNQATARAQGNVAPGVRGSAADRASTEGMSPTDVARAAINRKAATKDYRDEDNSFLDEVGNFIAGMFGFREMDPQLDPLGEFTDVMGSAQWGVDPVQAGLNIAGALFPPAKIAGTLYGGAVSAGIVDPTMIGFGYDRARPQTAAAVGKSQNQSKRGGTGGRGEKDGQQLLTGKSTTSGKSVAPTAATPETPTEAKSPADILLDKYKLPGINAPFALSPYTIDRTRHEQLVTQAMQGRGGE